MKKKIVNLRDLKPDSEEHTHDDGHNHDHGNGSAFKTYIPVGALPT